MSVLVFNVSWYSLTCPKWFFGPHAFTCFDMKTHAFDALDVWNHAENLYNLPNREVWCIYPVLVDTQVCLTKKINSSLEFRASQLLQSHALICIDVNMHTYIQGLRNRVPCAGLHLGPGLVRCSWESFSTYNRLYSKLRPSHCLF